MVLTVATVDGNDAECHDDQNRTELVATELVGPVRPGDRLLVHAGVAIERVWPSQSASKFVDEFRDAGLAEVLGREITALCEPGRPYKIMEVCGGHTHTIYRYGVHDHLPEQIELGHGPGCPVCVIPMGRVDDGIAIAKREGVILTCFGDMMRVPGGRGSFLEANARGADIRMVYSPLDALGSPGRTPTDRSSSTPSGSRRRPRRRR